MAVKEVICLGSCSGSRDFFFFFYINKKRHLTDAKSESTNWGSWAERTELRTMNGNCPGSDFSSLTEEPPNSCYSWTALPSVLSGFMSSTLQQPCQPGMLVSISQMKKSVQRKWLGKITQIRRGGIKELNLWTLKTSLHFVGLSIWQAEKLDGGMTCLGR